MKSLVISITALIHLFLLFLWIPEVGALTCQDCYWTFDIGFGNPSCNWVTREWYSDSAHAYGHKYTVEDNDALILNLGMLSGLERSHVTRFGLELLMIEGTIYDRYSSYAFSEEYYDEYHTRLNVGDLEYEAAGVYGSYNYLFCKGACKYVEPFAGVTLSVNHVSMNGDPDKYFTGKEEYSADIKPEAGFLVLLTDRLFIRLTSGYRVTISGFQGFEFSTGAGWRF